MFVIYLFNMDELTFAIPWMLFLFCSFAGSFMLLTGLVLTLINKSSKKNSPNWIKRVVIIALGMLLYSILYFGYIFIKSTQLAAPVTKWVLPT